MCVKYCVLTIASVDTYYSVLYILTCIYVDLQHNTCMYVHKYHILLAVA